MGDLLVGSVFRVNDLTKCADVNNTCQVIVLDRYRAYVATESDGPPRWVQPGDLLCLGEDGIIQYYIKQAFNPEPRRSYRGRVTTTGGREDEGEIMRSGDLVRAERKKTSFNYANPHLVGEDGDTDDLAVVVVWVYSDVSTNMTLVLMGCGRITKMLPDRVTRNYDDERSP